jgi:uncharacterized protein YdcH (DUF465 family)
MHTQLLERLRNINSSFARIVNRIDSMISTVETDIQKCHTIVQTHRDKVVTEDDSS